MECQRCGRAIAPLHLAVEVAFLIARTSLGLLTGSKALIVSALFSVQGGISAGVVALDTQTAPDADRGDPRHPFGHGKVEFLLAGGTSLLLFVGVAVFCATIAHSLLEHRQRPPQIWAAGAALIGALGHLLLGRHAACAARRFESSALVVHACHCRSDAWASLAVAASVFVARLGLELADPIAAVALATYVIWGTGRSLLAAVKGLLDASVGPDEVAAIEAAARVGGARDIVSLKAIRSGQKVFVSLAVDLPDTMSLEEADRVGERIKAGVRRLGPVEVVLVGFRAGRSQEALAPLGSESRR